MDNLSFEQFYRLLNAPYRPLSQAERLVCSECGKNFYKRVNTKIDNSFCSEYCQDEHDFRRYYKIPVGKQHISNARIIAKTQQDYYGGYSE